MSILNSQTILSPVKYLLTSDRLEFKASLVAQSVKNPPAMEETWILSLGQEDPLEKELATHFFIIALEIPWTEESGGLQSVGSQELDMT